MNLDWLIKDWSKFTTRTSLQSWLLVLCAFEYDEESLVALLPKEVLLNEFVESGKCYFVESKETKPINLGGPYATRAEAEQACGWWFERVACKSTVYLKRPGPFVAKNTTPFSFKPPTFILEKKQ